MDDIDRIIKDVVERFFEEGHAKISARIIARKTNVPLKVVCSHITKHELKIEWEQRARGIVVIKKIK
jgi:hypothetical protein